MGGVWRLEVLIQMPPETSMDETAQFFEGHGADVQVFRDHYRKFVKAFCVMLGRFLCYIS